MIFVNLWFKSGKLRRNEKSFSNSDRRKTSTNRGSFCPIFDRGIPLSNPFPSPASTEGYIAELRFFSKAAANPAAQTYQGLRRKSFGRPPSLLSLSLVKMTQVPLQRQQMLYNEKEMRNTERLSALLLLGLRLATIGQLGTYLSEQNAWPISNLPVFDRSSICLQGANDKAESVSTLRI